MRKFESVNSSSGSITGTKFFGLQETQPKWWNIKKHESFATVVALRTLVSNKANSHTPKMEIHTNYAIFAIILRIQSEATLSTKFCHRLPGWSVHTETISSRLQTYRFTVGSGKAPFLESLGNFSGR